MVKVHGRWSVHGHTHTTSLLQVIENLYGHINKRTSLECSVYMPFPYMVMMHSSNLSADPALFSYSPMGADNTGSLYLNLRIILFLT